MKTYSIDLINKNFVLNGVKYNFSSADKIKIRTYLGNPIFFMKQIDTMKNSINEIQILPKLAQDLINDAYVQITILDEPKIGNLNEYNVLENDHIEINIEDDSVKFMICRPTGYVSISNNVAHYLINCAHMKIKFQDAFSVKY